jgi:queuine tRNA-ribosyltransferase
MSLKFNLSAVDGNARRGCVETAHGSFQTPAFMAVGTAATVKALTMDMVSATGTEVILGNTYHLMLRPGGDLIERMGGLHEFSGWRGPILTDSGGFQAMSLATSLQKVEGRRSKSEGIKSNDNSDLLSENSPSLCDLRSAAFLQKVEGRRSKSEGIKSNDNSDMLSENSPPLCDLRSATSLVKVTEEGVLFTSHIDGGQKHFLTPEKSVQIQHQLDSDITMVLDECLRLPASRRRVEENVEMVARWAERSKAAFVDRPGYGIFGIVQGADFADLRARSAELLTKIGFDGYAVGGLAVGEPQSVMFDMLERTAPLLPKDRPRYLMGVGTPLDILGAVQRGIDMFDCVMPTRAGRTAQAFTARGTINLRNARFRDDPRTLDDLMWGGAAPSRREEGASLAYIHHLVKSNEILGAILLTMHNLKFYQELMGNIRLAIGCGNFLEFKKEFEEKYNG